MDRYEIDEYLRECSERAQERDLLEIERGDEARLWPDDDERSPKNAKEIQPMNHFTPGPWTISDSVSHPFTTKFVNGPGHFGAVCMLQAQDDKSAGIDNNDANARLIAAAPEMLEALRIVSRCVPDSEGGTTLGSYEMGKVRDALAAALSRVGI